MYDCNYRTVHNISNMWHLCVCLDIMQHNII
jgi:hypothetical protein